MTLQFDNCAKDNKNLTMLAFCGWLVTIGWFAEIQMYFLPQGHTHEDVDQMFSVLEKHMQTYAYPTLQKLFTAIPSIYTDASTRPTNEMMSYCIEWDLFFKPHIAKITGHSEPHAFCIKKNLQHGNAQLLFKSYDSQEKNWQGHEKMQEGICIFDSFPSGEPTIMKPKAIEQKVIADVRAIIKNWNDATDCEWWKSILDSNGASLTSQCTIASFSNVPNFVNVNIERSNDQLDSTTTSIANRVQSLESRNAAVHSEKFGSPALPLKVGDHVAVYITSQLEFGIGICRKTGLSKNNIEHVEVQMYSQQGAGPDAIFRISAVTSVLPYFQIIMHSNNIFTSKKRLKANVYKSIMEKCE